MKGVLAKRLEGEVACKMDCNFYTSERTKKEDEEEKEKEKVKERLGYLANNDFNFNRFF
jgi:hypothetical protein